MQIVYMQGTHKRTVYTNIRYVARVLVLLGAMGYKLVSVKSRY